MHIFHKSLGFMQRDVQALEAKLADIKVILAEENGMLREVSQANAYFFVGENL